MTGAMKMKTEPGDFNKLFDLQADFQKVVTGIESLPMDDVDLFQYHMSAMTEELGEVLKADKRWKTHRNTHYDPGNKLEELADVFITAINLSLFSGFTADAIRLAIAAKIHENNEKLKQIRGGTK